MKLKVSPYAWVSFAMIVGVMGTALISPLYALYKADWQLQTSQITLIYVLYMVGALSGLLFLGRLPDRLGFRPVMKLGLLFTLSGTLLCLLATAMPLLIVGRILVGLSSSMLITSASLGLAALSSNPSPKQTATMTGFLMAFGFGLGPLLGGIMGQWAPMPLRSTYVPVLVLASLGWLALHRLQLPENHPQNASNTTPRKPLHWRELLPQLTWPDASVSGAFALTCVLPFLAFGVFGLYASMSPLFLDQLVSWHGPVVSGSAIAVILLASACVQIMTSRMPTHWCGSLGLLSMVLSNALLLINLKAGSGLLFGLGVALAASGHGMSMVAGMSMVNQIARPENRSGLLSTYLVVGYMGSILPMLGMGWVADHWGISASVAAFCCSAMVVGSLTALRFQRHPHMRCSEATPNASAGSGAQALPETAQASR